MSNKIESTILEESDATKTVYRLSNGEKRDVISLINNDNNANANARSATTTGNASITCYKLDSVGNKTTSTIVNVNQIANTQMVFGITVPGYSSGYKTITRALLRFRVSSGAGELRMHQAFPTIDGSSFMTTYTPEKYLDLYEEITIDGIKYREVNITANILGNPAETHYFTATALQSAVSVSLYTELSEYKPQLIVDYIENDEFAKNQQFIEGNADSAGSYSVNVRTGKLYFDKNLISLDGNLMPLNLSIGYSLDYHNTQSVGSITTNLPKGWKFNYQQTCYASGSYYYYIDGAYKKHVFEQAPDGSYYDTSGTYLRLIITNSDRRITDDNGTTLIFTSGKLTEIRDERNETAICTTITYDADGKLTKITDGMGRETTFTYTNTAITITRPDLKTVVLTINANGCLSQITEADGKINAYTYVEKSGLYFPAAASVRKPALPLNRYLLQSATSFTGKKVLFETVNEVNIVKIYEYIGASVLNYYRLQQRVLNSEVDYGKNSSSVSQTTRYVYDDNGQIFMSYNVESGAISNVNVQNLDKNTRQKANTNKQPILTFNISDENIQSTGSTAEKTYSLANTPTNIQTGEYVLYATVMVNNSAQEKEAKENSLTLSVDRAIFIKNTLASIPFNVATSGLQNKSAIVNLTTLDSIMGLKAKVKAVGNVKAQIKEIKLIPIKSFKITDYVTCNTGIANPVQEYHDGINYRTWYKLINCTIKYGMEDNVITNVTITATDIIRSQKNKAKGINAVWYNDGKNCLVGQHYVRLCFGTNEYYLDEFLCGTITESNGKKTFSYLCVNAPNFYYEYYTVDVFNNVGKVCLTTCDYNDRTLYVSDSRGVNTSYTYDSFGNATFISSNYGNETITLQDNYGTDGKFLYESRETVSGVDNVTAYEYELASGNLLKTIDPNSQATNYSYVPANNNDLQKISSTINGTENANAFTYNAKGQVATSSHNGMEITYGYDAKNNLSQVNIAGSTVYNNVRTYGSAISETITYGNEQTRYNYYDFYGRLRKTGTSSTEIEAEYLYADKMTVDGVESTDFSTIPDGATFKSSKDSKLRRIDSGTDEYVFNYDKHGKLVSQTENSNSTEYVYDERDRVVQEKATLNGTTVQEDYVYTDGDAINQDYVSSTTTTCGTNALKKEVVCDAFNRTTQIKRGFNNGDGITEKYSYTNGSHRLYQDAYYKNNSTAPYLTENFTYDANGNIVHRTLTTASYPLTTTYEYDKLNRVIRENNESLNKTFVYTYDAGGNVTCKKTFAYTSAQDLSNLAHTEVVYSYDAVHKDRLTSLTQTEYTLVDGVLTASTPTVQTIAYDGYGNPNAYKGNAITWTKGTHLATFNQYNYNYDVFGQLKSISWTGEDGFKRNRLYYYSNGKLIAENRNNLNFAEVQNSKSIIYLYTDNDIVGLQINGTAYYYRKNIFGDIVGIVNASGTEVGAYEYDAWGNCTITNNVNDVATINPFRYRGYYFDSITGLYWLQTRFYDATTGRFISPDTIEYLSPETINGLNLYAYCNNNPIMNVDPSGHWVISLIIATTLSALASAIASFFSQLILEKSVDWGEVGISAFFGAVSGALAFTGIGGPLGQFFIQGGLSVLETVTISAKDGTLQELDFVQLAGDFIFSGALGAFGAKGAKANFKRISQIEQSLFHVLKRDFRKYGWQGLKETWKKKSKKYMNDFVKKILVEKGIDIPISIFGNMGAVLIFG